MPIQTEPPSQEIVIAADRRDALRGEALVQFLQQESIEEVSQVWLEAVETGDDQRLSVFGLAPQRDLWQLRVDLPCELPEIYSPVEVRPFQASDQQAFLDVNRAAFAWHPEQGRLDAQQFHTRTQEAWYNPAGFLILEIDNQLAGFCWTKIHRDNETPLGEIYAIAVAPDFSGQRLGAPLTHAGLDFLANSGIQVGMLYVEADNTPAQKIYRKLGFWLHQVNRAYRKGR